MARHGRCGAACQPHSNQLGYLAAHAGPAVLQVGRQGRVVGVELRTAALDLARASLADMNKHAECAPATSAAPCVQSACVDCSVALSQATRLPFALHGGRIVCRRDGGAQAHGMGSLPVSLDHGSALGSPLTLSRFFCRVVLSGLEA